MNTSTQELCGAITEHSQLSAETLSSLHSFYQSCWHEYGHLEEPKFLAVHTCNPITLEGVTMGVQGQSAVCNESVSQKNKHLCRAIVMSQEADGLVHESTGS